VVRLDGIRLEMISLERESWSINATIVEKMVETRLMWFGQVERRENCRFCK
jgi:hypothetical protein